MRLRVTQTTIADTLEIDQADVSKILRGAPKAKHFSPEYRDRVLRCAERLGYKHWALKNGRQAVRKELDAAVRVAVLTHRGAVHAKGEATLTNLSRNGALLCNLRLRPETLPTGLFRLRLDWRSNDGTAIRIEGEPVRFERTRCAGLGVTFRERTAVQERILQQFVREN